MDLFKKYQHLLLRFANTQVGRDRLLIPNDLGTIVKLSPNSYHEYLGGKTLKGKFYTHKDYEQILLPALTALDTIQYQLRDFKDAQKALLHYLDLRKDKFPLVLNTTYTGNSNAGGDGDIYNGPGNFATNRAASTGTLRTGGDADGIYIDVEGTDPNQYIGRVFLPFDTSSIPDTAVLNGSTILSTYKQSIASSGLSVVVTKSTQASFTNLVATDFDNLTLNSPTEYATRLAATSWNTGAYTNITLTNQAIVDVTSYTPFCLRMSDDVDNNNASNNTTLRIYSGSEVTTANAKPLLTITYDLVIANVVGDFKFL